MSCLFQFFSIVSIMFLMETTRGTPLFQGFSVRKGFEVKLQPFQFKPLSIFKEKWSPFGRFGIRKGIQKRDLSSTSMMPPAPVFEQIDEPKPIVVERKDNIEVPSTVIRPEPESSKPLSSNLIRTTESVNPTTNGLYTSVSRILPVNNIPKNPGPVTEELYGELPPRPVGPFFEPSVDVRPQPVSAIPIQPNTPIPVQQIGFFPVKPVNSIAEGPVLNPGEAQPSVPQEVIPIVTPPPRLTNILLSEIPPTDGPLVRGSKLALYYGNVFLQLVSEFIRNARLQFSQLRSSPTTPPVPINK